MCTLLTPLRMAPSEHQDISAGENEERLEPLAHCWWGWKMVQPLWKQYGGSQKNKQKQNYHMATLHSKSTAEYVLQRTESRVSKRNPHTTFTAAEGGGNPCSKTDGWIHNKAYTLSGVLCVFSRSVMSHSLRPHGLWPARLLCPWDSPSKNTGVGSHAQSQKDILFDSTCMRSLESSHS